MQATILDLAPSVTEGVSRKTNQPYRIVTQAAILHFPNGKNEAANLRVFSDLKTGKEQPLPPGKYTLAPDSFYLKDGVLTLSPKWLPAEGRGGAK
jgi:hypothetical protein